MKKILLTLVLLILFIPVANAEECTLVSTYSSEDYYFKSGSFGNYYLTPRGETKGVSIPFTINTYYTVYFDNADTVILNNYTFSFAGSDYLTINKTDYYYHFTAKQEYSANIFTKAPLSEWTTLFIYSSDTDTICLPKSESETPDEPIIPDSTLDSFYTIFIDKLSSFANYSVENKFILGSLGIVLLLIVLQIILNLFRKGGYR